MVDIIFTDYVSSPEACAQRLKIGDGLCFLDIFHEYRQGLSRAIEKLPSSKPLLDDIAIRFDYSPRVKTTQLTEQEQKTIEENNEDIIALLDIFNENWIKFISLLDIVLICQGLINRQKSFLGEITLDDTQSMTLKLCQMLIDYNLGGKYERGRNSIIEHDEKMFRALCETEFERFIRDNMGLDLYSRWKPIEGTLCITHEQQIVKKNALKLGTIEGDKIFDTLLNTIINNQQNTRGAGI
jgi:hypothetical protein